MKIVNAIIEARMGSTRLPGKTMMTILDRPVLGPLIERLKYARRINNIIVATPKNREDDVIEKFCRKNNIECFRGPSEDVLGRVYSAAKRYNTDIIVEVTADCPLLDPLLIDKCMDIFLNSDYDYLSNFIEQSYPPGIDVQIFKFEILQRLNRLAKDKRFREHVTLYILKHPERFKLYNVIAPKEMRYPDWHLELDEYKDYELIKRIFENLYQKNPKFTTFDIIDLLKRNPDWLEINKWIERRWEKVRSEEIK